MVLLKATRTAISALISASICFTAVEAQDHGAASGQKQTIGGGGRDDQTPAGEQSNEISATKHADEQGGKAQNFKNQKALFSQLLVPTQTKIKGARLSIR